MRIGDWSSDVCSSDLEVTAWGRLTLSYSARCFTARALDVPKDACGFRCIDYPDGMPLATREGRPFLRINGISVQGEEITDLGPELPELRERSEEHTSELQSLMRISYAVFCLKKKNKINKITTTDIQAR